MMKPPPYPGFIPPWQDKATLAAHLSVSVSTIETWSASGIIPPGRLKGGKLMWKWAEVDAWMDNAPGEAKPGSITDAVRQEREADRANRH